MAKNPSRRGLEQKDSNSWMVEDARVHFDALLAAASQRGPQRIVDDGREFTVSLSRATATPIGNKLLSKGGPIENH